MPSVTPACRSSEALEPVVQAAPDQQVSLTDPDARSMATSGRGSAMVGDSVQAAVDAQHHLIVAHEVSNAPPSSTCSGLSRSGWAPPTSAPGPSKRSKRR
jgi:hypothetical protein